MGREKALQPFSHFEDSERKKNRGKIKTHPRFLLFRVFVCFLCATLSLARNKETRTKERNGVGEKRQIIKKSKAKSNYLKNKKETGIYTKQKKDFNKETIITPQKKKGELGTRAREEKKKRK